jgi:hypothetical protein
VVALGVGTKEGVEGKLPELELDYESQILPGCKP